MNHRNIGTYTVYMFLSHVFVLCFGHNVRENVPCPGFLKPVIWNSNESDDRVTSSIWIITGFFLNEKT